MYVARANLLKLCLVFIEKNVGLYMEALHMYIYVQINLNIFLTHTSYAEVPYIIFSGGSIGKIFCTDS